MKRLLLCCCCLLPGTASANASALDGDWFILSGRTVVSSADAKHAAVKKLSERGQEADLQCVAFTAGDEWVALSGQNRVDWAFVGPASLPEVLRGGKVRSREYRCVAFRPQGGWVLLYDKNGYAEDGIPAAVSEQLERVRQAGGTLRSVAFAPDGGWVVLFDHDFKAEGVPAALTERLAEQRAKGVAVRCVAFTSRNDWFLLTERNECLGSNPAHPAFQRLEQLRAEGKPLTWVAFTAGEYATGYALERRPARRIKGVLNYSIDEPDGGVRAWVLYAPQAPELARQRDPRTTLDPPGRPVQEAGVLRRPLLVSQVTGKPQGLQTKLTYEATLYSTRLVPRLAGAPPADEKLRPAERDYYTSAAPSVDFREKRFQEWLDEAGLRRADRESDMTLARRTFSYLKHHFHYEYFHEGMDQRPAAVCRAGKSDCSGLSRLFVAVMRANRVPARPVVGRLAKSEVPGKTPAERTEYQTHVQAEFFVPELGWVPVDMANAVADAGREFAHFGNDAGDFLVMHIDSDVVVEDARGAKARAGGMQVPFWSFQGSSRKGERVEQHWTVEATDLSGGAASVPHVASPNVSKPAAPAAEPPREAATPPPPRAAPATEPPPPESVRTPRPPAAATPTEKSALAKAVAASPQAADEGKGKDADAGQLFFWLLPVPIVVGTRVVVALLVGMRRRRTPKAGKPPAAVARRCVHCGAVLKVPSAQPGQKLKCPGCGTALKIVAK
jgi:transglutaminase-like putative cysteine protease